MARRRGSGKPPIVLSPQHIRRILQRRASVVILRRRQLRSIYEVHDQHRIARNAQHCKAGRADLQSEPHVFSIEVSDVDQVPLDEILLPMARLAGFKTTAELREDWALHHPRHDMTLPVFAHSFTIVDVRYLHRQVSRGYTTNPSEAAWGEPQALSEAELAELSRAAERRRESAQPTEFKQRKLRSLSIRMKDAARQGDFVLAREISDEMARTLRESGEAA